jgi:hypothetical protein
MRLLARSDFGGRSEAALGLANAIPEEHTDGASGQFPNGLSPRLAWLAALLAAEWLPISAWVSTGRVGQSAARALAVFVFFLFFIRIFQDPGRRLAAIPQLEGTPISWRLLLAHFKMMGSVPGPLISPFRKWWPSRNRPRRMLVWNRDFEPRPRSVRVCAACAMAWSVAATGHVWALATVVAALSWRFVLPLWSVWDGSLWEPAIDATFHLTRFLLEPFLPALIADRATLVMGTQRFAVTIAGPCSGLEGAGLMLVFSMGWL